MTPMKVVFILFGLSFTNPLWALDKVAQAVLLKGEVRVKSNKDQHVLVLKQGEWVGEGDIIQTAGKSFVKLLFIDKTQMNVGPESKMAISKFPQKEAGIITLLQGKIRSEVTKDMLKKSEENDKAKLFIRTKSAAMGIRGTDFQVVYNPENLMTSLVTFEGQVMMAQTDPDNPPANNNAQDMQNIVTSDNAVLVSEGQFSGANPQQETATIPVKISPAQLETLRTNPSFQEAAAPEGEKAKSFQSPIPPGVTPKAFMNNNVEITKQIEKGVLLEEKKTAGLEDKTGDKPGEGKIVPGAKGPEAGGVAAVGGGERKDAPPPEGSYNAATGAFAPPAGGFVDLKTGLYISPPPGSTFDANTGVYVPPPSMGKFDPSTGNYVPPAGFKLESDGRFAVDTTAFAKTDPEGKDNKDMKREERKEDKKEDRKDEKRPENEKADGKEKGPLDARGGNRPEGPPLDKDARPMPPPPPNVALTGGNFIPPDIPMMTGPMGTGGEIFYRPPTNYNNDSNIYTGQLPPLTYGDLINQLEQQRDQDFQNYQNSTQTIQNTLQTTTVNFIINVL